MAIILVGAFFNAVGAAEIGLENATAAWMGAMDTILLAAEILAVFFYLQATHKSDEARLSAKMALSGKFAAHFWAGVIFLGLLVPIVINAFEARSILMNTIPGIGWGVIASACGLFGGLLLRYVVLACGVRAPLRVGGMKFSFPTPPVRVQ
jgi:formate-dependent nitrite reductase membrane component NrfD